MNIIEAVIEAYAGKRIRRKHIEGSKEEKFAAFLGEDILADDWEVLED